MAGCRFLTYLGRVISTERLELRHFRDSDAEAFAAYRSVPEVARFQSWDAPYPLDQARTTVAGFATSDPLQPGWFQYAIDLDGVLIGDLGLNLHENLMQAELGFTLAPAYQGKGYEGFRPANTWFKGEWTDDLLFGLLSRDWTL